MLLKGYIRNTIWIDYNCVIFQVCEAKAGEAEKTRQKEREGERECTVKTLFKITIDLGLKNRNPLFPELEITAMCYVIIRYVCVQMCVGKGKSY